MIYSWTLRENCHQDPNLRGTMSGLEETLSRETGLSHGSLTGLEWRGKSVTFSLAFKVQGAEGSRDVFQGTPGITLGSVGGL